MKQRSVFFDLETTGLDASEHVIIQVAAIAVDDQLNELETFEEKLQFDVELATKESMEIAKWGKRGHLWKDALTPLAGAYAFADFLRSHATTEKLSKRGRPYKVATLVGHNAARFDSAFLWAWFKAMDPPRGLYLPADYHVVDTISMAQALRWAGGLEVRDLKLATLCEHFGIELGEEAHDALVDARATLELARVLTDRLGGRGEVAA